MQQEINNNFSKEDEFYMKRAIELAKRGTGWVNPNPLVGAVIVKDDRIIGEGWHRKCPLYPKTIVCPADNPLNIFQSLTYLFFQASAAQFYL